jgi:hypothetical protein
LANEIKELKKNRRALEKTALKSIKTLLKSEETPEKKRSEKHKIKKEMKSDLVSTKTLIRQKAKELAKA